jgi:hypothetical protein
MTTWQIIGPAAILGVSIWLTVKAAGKIFFHVVSGEGPRRCQSAEGEP